MKKMTTKERILKKAIDLFYEHGFVKASIRDIVAAVGVTNSTVYIHFRNKDEILFSIIEHIGTVLLETLQEATESHEDPIECLREMIFRQVCVVKEKKKEVKIYIEEQSRLPPKLRKAATDQHRKIFRVFHEKIREAKEKSLIADINETVMTFCIFGMMNWAYHWFNEKGELSIEEVAQQIIHIFFQGILKKEALAARGGQV